MSLRQSIGAVLLFLTGLTVGVSLNRTTSGQPPAATPGWGRFQAMKDDRSIIVIDSETGRTWTNEFRATSSRWVDLGARRATK